MEILLLAGNGYGVGAQKLLRGLYGAAVTARYISQHPEKAEWLTGSESCHDTEWSNQSIRRTARD